MISMVLHDNKSRNWKGYKKKRRVGSHLAGVAGLKCALTCLSKSIWVPNRSVQPSTMHWKGLLSPWFVKTCFSSHDRELEPRPYTCNQCETYSGVPN